MNKAEQHIQAKKLILVQYNCRGYKRDEFTKCMLENADVVLFNET